MAAASKTSASFHNMPHRNGTYMATHGSTSSSDATPDLHLKMSKKIAQLTKVIYALNTKNDEHESVLDTLKKSHEEEMQQLIAETKNKIEYFKNRLGVVSEQRQKIELLESHVSKERLQREEALSEFQIFKQLAEEREAKLRNEYSEKMLAISREMLTSKKHFEDRLKDFQSMRRKFEEDRDKAVESLTGKHHEELDQLMKAHRVRYDEVVKEKQKVEKDLNEKLARALAQAEAKTDNALDEKMRIEKEYQDKMDKLKTFYEKELAALRTTLESQAKESVEKSWEEKENQLKQSWSRQERIFKDRISELLNQLSDGEQELSNLKSQLREMDGQVQNKHSDAVQLSRELEESRKETSNALAEVRELQNELVISRKKCKDQGAEISRQSSHIGKLEATKLSQETNIRSLKANINELNSKLSKYEGDYEELEKQYKTHFMESGEHIQSLKEEISKVTAQKLEIEGKYLKELNLSKESASERENKLKSELEETSKRLKAEHTSELETLHSEYKDKLRKLDVELKEQAQNEKATLLLEKSQAVSKIEKECDELKRKLNNIEVEAARLNSLVQESEKGLGSASSHIDSLKQSLNQTKDALEKTHQELQDTNERFQLLQGEHAKLQSEYDQYKIDAAAELQNKLLSLKTDIDEKWAERLSKECSELREGLQSQHNKERELALQEMSYIKDQEKEEVQTELQNKIASLRVTITELRSALDKRKADASIAEQELRAELNQQRRRLEEELAKAAFEHGNKMQSMQEEHAEEMRKAKEMAEQDLKDLEARLEAKYREESSFNLQANKVALEAVKSQQEKQRQKELADLKNQHEADQEALRNELVRKQQADVQRLNKEYETQMMALKLQLQRTAEIRERQEAEFELKLDDLRADIQERDSQIKELDSEMAEVTENIAKLQHELQGKGQEILSIRRESNAQFRKREEELAKLHQREVDSLTADHLCETQSMLEQFNRAKELQRDKISALQLMLEEAEIRFKSRESRTEDLDLIQELKQMLAERELEMKKLLEEKRYFQLELLNRETNFNRVFNKNGAPNVGVINPLNAKTKVTSKASQSTSGMLMSSSRLDPIPQMPVHEKRLNNSKVLPPTPPKDPPPNHRRTIVY
ncbi:protein FAM184A isoform X2 [Nematostella vectensis]|uniref:protein FAM184A isoform X2 n=1 Tax=Nematostella vectensis TaxID=45351 RepID=UPI0013905C8A|nr:protein FAM184A isoform X2 [Nematostella vectensis]